MEESILRNTKKILGVDPEDESFDVDIITHINSVFSTLTQLGLGPVGGFVIEGDEEEWNDFLETDLEKNSVRTYMFLKVRLFFDPPQTSFVLDALNRQAEQLEWRLNVNREHDAWVDPNPPALVGDDE